MKNNLKFLLALSFVVTTTTSAVACNKEIESDLTKVNKIKKFLENGLDGSLLTITHNYGDNFIINWFNEEIWANFHNINETITIDSSKTNPNDALKANDNNIYLKLTLGSVLELPVKALIKNVANIGYNDFLTNFSSVSSTSPLKLTAKVNSDINKASQDIVNQLKGDNGYYQQIRDHLWAGAYKDNFEFNKFGFFKTQLYQEPKSDQYVPSTWFSVVSTTKPKPTWIACYYNDTKDRTSDNFIMFALNLIIIK